MMPLFSATKTRPSDENSTFVGWLSPASATVSTNPSAATAAPDTSAATNP
jgi:hypothetical protein